MREIAGALTKAMAPVISTCDRRHHHAAAAAAAEEDDIHDDDDVAAAAVVRRCCAVAPAAIEALTLLLTQKPTGVVGEEETLLTLASFASVDGTYGWSPPQVVERAAALLDRIPPVAEKTESIVETVLQRHVRPLFSRSKPVSVTSSGRKAAFADPDTDTRGIPDDSSATKPWKYVDFRTIPLVAWAVTEADVCLYLSFSLVILSFLSFLSFPFVCMCVRSSHGEYADKSQEHLISRHWPLFIPVLLTLADVTTSRIRRQGLIILGKFLTKVPDKTLHDTGLAKVFEDAIFPTLSYLPSLTPEAESVELLAPAFDALRCLADKQLSTTAGKMDSSGNNPSNRQQKHQLLDRILRDGIFNAYFHAKDHIRIIEVLCQQTTLVLNQLGIQAVKHLKVSVPSYHAVM